MRRSDPPRLAGVLLAGALLSAVPVGCAAPVSRGVASGASPALGAALGSAQESEQSGARELRDEWMDGALPDGWDGAIWLGFGGRFLADATLDAVDDQRHWELDLEAGDEGSPFRWQMGFHYSTDDATVNDPILGPTKSDATVFETTVGGILLLDLGQRLVPYVGAFGSLVYVDADLVQAGLATTDSDVSVGASWRAGARLMLSERSFVGVDVRQLLLTDLDLGSLPVDADGWLVGLTFGTGL